MEVTISLSNLIKAYSVKYNDTDKRVIDTNAAAQEKLKHYIQLLKLDSSASNGEEGEQSDDSLFVPGLFAATVEEIPEVEQEDRLPQQRLIQEALLKEQQKPEEVTEKANAIIQEAKEEVKHILEKAKSEAMACSEQIKQDAFQTGYQEGYQKAMIEFESLKNGLELERKNLNLDYETKVREMEPTFVHLLIAYIKRFTGVILEDKKDIILYLLEQELLSIEKSNAYLIHVSKEDYDMVYAKKHEIAWKVNEDAQVEIVQDPMLTNGQCLIETDSRVIDCSLDVQLKNLIHDLKLLVGPKLNV